MLTVEKWLIEKNRKKDNPPIPVCAIALQAFPINIKYIEYENNSCFYLAFPPCRLHYRLILNFPGLCKFFTKHQNIFLREGITF